MHNGVLYPDSKVENIKTSIFTTDLVVGDLNMIKQCDCTQGIEDVDASIIVKMAFFLDYPHFHKLICVRSACFSTLTGIHIYLIDYFHTIA